MQSNVQKMREALKTIHSRVNSLDEECGVDPIEVRDIAREALKIPLRNCDTLATYDDFVNAWNNHVRSRKSASDPIPDIPEFLDWLAREKGGER